MSESNKTGLMIAFVVVVLLFLVFGGGMMTGWNGGGMMGNWGGGGMMGGGNTGGGTSGGFNLMWFPTLLFLGLGVLFGWMIFGRKR
jgi:hypothetical protein